MHTLGYWTDFHLSHVVNCKLMLMISQNMWCVKKIYCLKYIYFDLKKNLNAKLKFGINLFSCFYLVTTLHAPLSSSQLWD